MQTLLFDLDGTLTDPKKGILGSIRHALSRLGWTVLPEDEEIKWCIGPPIRFTFATLLKTDDLEEIETAVTLYRKQYDLAGKFENEVYQGIPEALSLFQEQGYGLYVATSKPQLFADQIVDHFGLRKFFIRVYGTDFSGKLDEKTDLLSHLLQQESLDAQDCVMIGDRKHDIIAAKANDIRSCGVTWGYGSEEELTLNGAGHLCHQPSQLTACLCL